MSRFEDPVPQFLDNAGDPIPGGKLFFYESGTSTPKATYADASQTIANTNPVILSASGRVGNVFYDGLARVVLKDDDDVQIWDRDPVGSSQIAGSIADWSSIVTYGTNDIVRSGDGVYQSLQSNNISKDPATNSDYWEEVRFIQVWNTNVTYMEDDIVQRGGFFYRSKTDSNTGNDPVGDTTNWGGTQSTDIADGSITLVKMEDMSQNEIIGRATAGTGSPEHLTAAQTRTILNVADGATANSTDAFLLARANHTGTQTMSTISDAGNLATLDDITLSLVTDSGALAALNTVGTTEIDNDAITLAKMAPGTAGGMPIYDAAGDPADSGAGVLGDIWTSGGPGAISSWQPLAAPTAPTALHDLTSTSDVTLTVAATLSAADFITAGKVIATKASVPLKTTDRLVIDLSNMKVDATATARATVRIWVRINAINSINGHSENGATQLSEIGRGQILQPAVTGGGINTYTNSFSAYGLFSLGLDFIGSDGSHTVDIVAVVQPGGGTPVVKGTTDTTTFKLRVEAGS